AYASAAAPPRARPRRYRPPSQRRPAPSRKLRADPQRLPSVLDLEEPRPLAPPVVGLVEHHHQLAVEAAEEHGMPAAVREEGLRMLDPRPGELTGGRFGDPHRVPAVAEAGPEHEQLAGAGTVEPGGVGDVAPLRLLPSRPRPVAAVEAAHRLPHR